ncbi:MAG: transposase, partial [Candidatus Scalindua sp.]
LTVPCTIEEFRGWGVGYVGWHGQTCLSVYIINMKYKIEQQLRKTVRHYNIPYHAHFLTFSCYRQLPLLNRKRTRNWLIKAILDAKERHKYALWAYVIMPEHVHLIIYPLVKIYDISSFLKSVKQSVARKAKHYLQVHDHGWLEKLTVKRGTRKVFRFWQTGPGYDRNINSENELLEKIHYVHNNPVRRGLVLTPHEWQWSSAGWYNGQRDVRLEIDDLACIK